MFPRHARRATYAFHVRAFGEELVRVAFHLLEACGRSVAALVDDA
jgi:hypothetical protein